MTHNQSNPRNGQGERGSVLIAVLFVALILSGLLAWAFSDSHSSMFAAQTRENYSQAQAAAEYGAELAIAQLTQLSRGEGTATQGQTTGDFVYGPFESGNNGKNLFRISGKTAQDQRRIVGIMDDQQFRVRVRSASLAHNINDFASGATMPKSWLIRPPEFGYNEPTSRFKDYYEITATARNQLAATGQAVRASLYPTAVVQAVVEMSATGSHDALDQMQTLHIPHPSNLQANNMRVSGEDHNLRKFFIEGGMASHVEKTEVQQGASSQGEYSAADGSYWKGGLMTLNYMRNDYPIPFYPQTKKLAADGNNKTMTTIGQVTRPATEALPTPEVKTFVANPVKLESDTYLIGGKSQDNVGYSVTTLPNSPWTIKETTVKEAAQNKKFDIVLGDYEDLMRIYIVRAGKNSDTPYPDKETVKLAKNRDIPYVEGHATYGKSSYRGADFPIYVDRNVDGNYMNFVGRKLGPHDNKNALTSISLPYYNDPFDNSSITEGRYRYYSKQYALRMKPGSETEKQILAMNLESVSIPDSNAQYKVIANGYIHGILLSTSGNIVNFANKTINWDASSSSSSTATSGKKVLWDLAEGEPAPVFRWDSSKGLYVPEEETIVIQLRNYPGQWNQKNEDFYFGGTVAKPDEAALKKSLDPMITARWPGLLDQANIVPGTEDLARDKVKYRVKWKEHLGLEGIKKDGPTSSNRFPDSVNYKPASKYKTNGVYIERTVVPDDEYQWFKWDGTYVWSDYKLVGDGNKARFENGDTAWATSLDNNMLTYLQRRNVIPRPFEVDELMGMEMAHDFRTLNSMKYGKVVVVDKDGNAIEKVEDEYPGSIYKPLTQAVKNDRGVWTDWRGGETGLVVYEPDATGKADLSTERVYSTMEDFMEDVPFSNSATGEVTTKRAVNLLVGLEDQTGTPDWDFNDIAFIVTIAPPIITEGGKSIETGVSKNYQQWWEQDETEGLTGGESIAAISTNGINGNTDPELAYKYLWSTLTWQEWMDVPEARRVELLKKAKKTGKTSGIPETDAALRTYPGQEDFIDDESPARANVIAALSQDMYSMMDKSTADYSTFGRKGDFRLEYKAVPVFDNAELPHSVTFYPPPAEEGQIGMPVIYYSTNNIKYYQAVCEAEFAVIDLKKAKRGGGDYTVSVSDEEESFHAYWSALSDANRELYAEGNYPVPSGNTYYNDIVNRKRMRLKDHLVESLGYTVKRISDRESEIYEALVAINSSKTEANPFEVLRRTITAREFTAGIFNEKSTITDQRVPTVLTMEKATPPGTWGPDTEKPLSIKKENIGYLAGEMKQDPTSKDAVKALTDSFVPFTTYYDDGKKLQGDGTPYTLRKFLAKSNADGAASDEQRAAAVDECYKQYYIDRDPNPQILKDIEEKWGVKDKRYSIGWHRYGEPDPKEDKAFYDQIIEQNLYDHYEITMLGVEGFHPYYEIDVDVDGQNKRLVERRRLKEIDYLANPPAETGDTTDTVVEKTGDDMPTFVFDKPIDGAGTMIVNGNLLIKDTFAFHGVFVVIGSVTVQSTYNPDREIYGEDGNYMYKDAEGNLHSLLSDEEGYYYVDTDGTTVRKPYTLNENNERVYDEASSLAPLKAGDLPDTVDQYTGHLVVQGAMLAGGTIRTTVEEGHEGKTQPGRIDLYSSQDARNAVDKMLPEGTPLVERLVWTHNDNINVGSLWNDEMDPDRD